MQLFEPISIKSCTDVSTEVKKICELYALEEQMVSFDVSHITTLFSRRDKKKILAFCHQRITLRF